jgi:uncharacterized membrane protein
LTNTFSNTRKLFSNDLVITLLLIAVAWIFYAINAGTSPFWFDELFSVYWTQYENVEDVKRVSYWDVGPPGFPVIVHYWTKMFGITEVAVRGLSNMCMAISFGLLYFLTKRFFDLRMAIIVSILFITNSFLYYYSNEARCYAFMLMLSIISNFVFAKMILDPKWYWAILLGVVNYYLYYTHYVIINLFVIQGFFAVICFNKRLFVWYVLSFVPFILLLLPFMQRVIDILNGKVVNNFDAPTVDTLTLYLSGYFNNRYFGLFLLTLLIVGIVVYFKNRNRVSASKPTMVFWYLVCSGIGYIVLTYIISVFKSPIFNFRYMIPSYTGVMVLIAFFVSRVSRSRVVFGAATLSILIFGLCTISLNTYKGSNAKRQMAFAKSKSSPKTAIITDNALLAYYYDIEAFKQVPDIKGALQKLGVYEMWDASSLHGFDYWKYDSVIVVASWGNTNDLLKGKLSKHYPKCEQLVYHWDGCFTYVYHR